MLDKTSEATRHHKQFQTFNHKRLKIDYYELEIKNFKFFLKHVFKDQQDFELKKIFVNLIGSKSSGQKKFLVPNRDHQK